MAFLVPKVQKPQAVKSTPTLADARSLGPEDSGRAYSSLISTSTVGLKRKASTQKRSLIGG